MDTFRVVPASATAGLPNHHLSGSKEKVPTRGSRDDTDCAHRHGRDPGDLQT